MAVSLDHDGAELAPGLAIDLLPLFEAELADVIKGTAGVRLAGRPGLARLLSAESSIGCRARDLLGDSARPVRAVLFDKTELANWQLDWHQDRTIALLEKREVEGFRNWNVKQGIVHAEPPFDLLQGMLTVRIHLDPVDQDNGVLEIVVGSHRCGWIAEARIQEVVDGGTVMKCPALAGDCWFYRTPILHRSARSRSVAPRRVLQVDYSAATLPGGLVWRGI